MPGQDLPAWGGIHKGFRNCSPGAVVEAGSVTADFSGEELERYAAVVGETIRVIWRSVREMMIDVTLC